MRAMLPTVSWISSAFGFVSGTIVPKGVSSFFSSSVASSTTIPSTGTTTCTISVRPRSGSSESVTRGSRVGSIFSSDGWMKNVMCRRIRMNFCCIIASLMRSVTSPMVNLRSLPGLIATVPVGLTVVMSVSPVSFEYQSRTSSQPAFSKWMLTVFAGAAGAAAGATGATVPGTPGTDIGAGWASARSTGPVSPAAAARTPGSHLRSFRSFQNGTARACEPRR